ncbi:MAG: kinetochore-associated Ndc80 complex subunit spc25 [Bogoriella megaspora]|nr:MAG: kinetochore-associated Ndc80 complex subunit spc25 [Bogoriella megaspora]
MATITFETSLSSSAIRPPLASAEAPSMADALPSIDFGFDDLRDRMARFTVRFDEFIEKGRKRVLEERNQFRVNLAELHDDQRMRKRDIEIVDLKLQTHSQSLSKEAQETTEMESAIAELSSQRDEKTSQRDYLREQVAETQKAIAARREAQQKHARYLDSQARFNVPELDFWQDYLCLRIEGAGIEDRLKFVYTHVDERDWEREAWFEIDMGSREYQVLHYKPKVEREAVDEVLEKLNESRDIGAFLKGMRMLFVQALK